MKCVRELLITLNLIGRGTPKCKEKALLVCHIVEHRLHSYNKTNCVHSFLKFIFGIKLRVSDSSSVHHQEFFTVHTVMASVIQVCWQLASRIRTEFLPDPAPKLSVLQVCCQLASRIRTEFLPDPAPKLYVLQVCWQLASRIRTEFLPDPAPKLYVL